MQKVQFYSRKLHTIIISDVFPDVFQNWQELKFYCFERAYIMTSCLFQTKEDYLKTLLQMIKPLKKHYSENKALVQLGYTGTHYSVRITGLEGFARILWGVIPLWYGGESCELDDYILEGIRAGTDPDNEEYWGNFSTANQTCVEMAPLGFALLAVPEKVWNPLSEQEKENFARWLWQINQPQISLTNNWIFFRVLVNCGLRRVGAKYSEEWLCKDLAHIDDFYLGEGWYSDGATAQRDYYIPFAMHFYSLIYAALCQQQDPVRCERYRKRAELFAQDFIYWFGKRGEALPFGRSLTYRFAQAAFWSAAAFANVSSLDWGVVKGIVDRHFRWWFSQPIFDPEGKLTLGYAYPNLTMCEGYNSPTSPYWALKGFLLLALPEDHPFWTSEEKPLPILKKTRALPHAGMLVQRNEDGYVTALTAGQYATWEPAFAAEKYEKFAYSSYFGFQTARAYNQLNMAAPDNMLSFWKDGMYHVRRQCESVTVTEDAVEAVWLPMHGIKVHTVVIPEGNGHIRKHCIEADYACTAVEAGFALPIQDCEEVNCEKSGDQIKLAAYGAECLLQLRRGKGKADWMLCEANVNVLHPRTALSYFTYEIPAGTTEVCIYVEGRAPSKENGGNTWM